MLFDRKKNHEMLQKTNAKVVANGENLRQVETIWDKLRLTEAGGYKLCQEAKTSWDKLGQAETILDKLRQTKAN